MSAKRRAPAEPDAVARAARFSRLPGVTIAAACARFGVPRASLVRARRSVTSAPTRGDLVLAALTGCGENADGVLRSLEALARWIDYVEHDGCTVEDVRREIALLVGRGVLAVRGEAWRLLVPWP